MSVIAEQESGMLVELSQLNREPLPPLFQEHIEDVQQVIKWVHEYLCNPHPELGRPGPVCPFVPTALEKNLLFMAIHAEHDLEREDFHDLLLQERDRFLNMEPTTGNDAQFKAFLLLFPNIPKEKANQIVENVQEDLRFKFVPRGLMVGEFHPGPPDKQGLWNKDFRPLLCPVPMLAIRHVVPTDILFLKDEHSLITEYLKIYGDMVPAKFRKYVEEAAERFGFDLPEKKPLKSSAATVIYHLQKNHVSYKVYRHSQCEKEIRKPQDFARELNYDLDRISKAVFLKSPDGAQFAIAVLPAVKQADLEILAQRAGIPKFVIATEEELEERVGQPPYTIAPMGVKGVSVFMDESLFHHETMLTGSGVTAMEIELAPEDLKRLSSAEVLSFAR